MNCCRPSSARPRRRTDGQPAPPLCVSLNFAQMRLRRREEKKMEEGERERGARCTAASCRSLIYELRSSENVYAKRRLEGGSTTTTVIDASSTVNSLDGAAVPQRLEDNFQHSDATLPPSQGYLNAGFWVFGSPFAPRYFLELACIAFF